MVQDCCEHHLDPWVAEAQGGRPAFVDDHGLVQFIEGRHPDKTVVTDALDVEWRGSRSP